MGSDTTKINVLTLSQHIFETEDSWFPLGQISLSGTFFTPWKNQETLNNPKVDPGSMFVLDVFMAPNVVYHTRQIYSLFDLLGDLGGVTQVISIIFGLIFLPIL